MSADWTETDLVRGRCHLGFWPGAGARQIISTESSGWETVLQGCSPTYVIQAIPGQGGMTIFEGTLGSRDCSKSVVGKPAQRTLRCPIASVRQPGSASTPSIQYSCPSRSPALSELFSPDWPTGGPRI